MLLSEGSCPYSCESLGKQILKYRNPPDGSVGQAPQSRDPEITLTIPESVLTWKGGNRAPGTQMLVFRATYAKKPVNKLKRTPLHLINFVSRKGCRKNITVDSRKGCRKNIAVEVNRLNFSDIGQNRAALAKAKQQLYLHNVHDSIKSEVFEEKDEKESLNSTSSIGGSNGRMEETSCTGESISSQQRGIQCCSTQVICNGMPVINNCTAENSWPSLDGNLSRGVTNSEPPLSVLEGKGKSSLSRHGLSQKKAKAKPKRAKMDASVMTELSFGTGIITDLSTVSHEPLHVSNHVDNFTPVPSFNTSNHHYTSNHTYSPPLTKKGFRDKCTSPKLLFRNGRFNGCSVNGYSIPEVAALREGILHPSSTEQAEKSLHGKQTATNVSGNMEAGISSFMTQHEVTTVQKEATKNGGNYLKRLPKCKKRIMKRQLKHKGLAGTGKRGTHSFLVSLPRVHYDSLPKHSDLLDTTLTPPPHNDETCGDGGTGGRPNSYRRRSEVQLLLDGDKPPGQRLSATEVPVFIAEDISNRSSRNVTGPNSPWLGSSTRKITPVEHFAFPLPNPFSPKKNPSSISGNVSSFPQLVEGSVQQHKKRHGSNRETSPEHPPPTKQPRVASSSSAMKSFDEKEREKVEDKTHGLDVLEEVLSTRKHPNGVTMSPSMPSPMVPEHGPLPKRDHLLPGQSEEVFGAELVVFDSRGECLIKDGKYSILMQSCSKSGLSTFEPLTWANVFGGGRTSKV